MRTLLSLSLALVVTGAAQAQCSSFQPAYPGLNGPVNALTSWTPAGSTTPRLVAGGSFTWNQGQGSQDYIAQWNGTSWDGFGWGTDGPVNAVTTWDHGNGQELIIGGEFLAVGSDSTGQLTANHIARWDGQSWQPLGTGADGPVDALITWDPDGDGPLPPELVAAGRFTHIGGAWTGGVAHWDGTAWHSFGWGIDGSGAALTVWDPDGPGPEIPNLVVGGNFSNAGADSTGQVFTPGIARWNGSQWSRLGAGLYGVRSLTTFDQNVDGSQTSRLVAAGGTGGYSLSFWGETGWLFVDGSFANQSYVCDPIYHCGCVFYEGSGYSLAVWDPDGDGPIPPQLYAGGVQDYSGQSCHGEACTGCQFVSGQWDILAHWNGSMWEGRQSVSAAAWTVFDPDAAGPASSMLVVGGSAAPYVNVLRTFDRPVITSEPVSSNVRAYETAHFSVAGLGSSTTFRWYRKRWVVTNPGYGDGIWIYDSLSDGPTGTGSTISGSGTSSLTIASVQSGDSAFYVCNLTLGTCSTFSADVFVGILPGSCTADFNHDGSPGTDQDIEAFFACLAGTCCPTCGSPDFNGDGDDRTDADIESFFRVLAGGPC